MTTSTGESDAHQETLGFRISALHERVHRYGEAVNAALARVVAIAQNMADTVMRAVGRGPDPDAPYPPVPDVNQIARLAAWEAARATVEIGTYNEGGDDKKKPEQSWQNRILGIVGLLIVGGISTTIYQLSELKAQVGTRATVDQMTEVKQQVAALAATQAANTAAMNQRLDANERRIENIERKVFQ